MPGRGFVESLGLWHRCPFFRKALVLNLLGLSWRDSWLGEREAVRLAKGLPPPRGRGGQSLGSFLSALPLRDANGVWGGILSKDESSF